MKPSQNLSFSFYFNPDHDDIDIFPPLHCPRVIRGSSRRSGLGLLEKPRQRVSSLGKQRWLPMRQSRSDVSMYELNREYHERYTKLNFAVMCYIQALKKLRTFYIYTGFIYTHTCNVRSTISVHVAQWLEHLTGDQDVTGCTHM